MVLWGAEREGDGHSPSNCRASTGPSAEQHSALELEVDHVHRWDAQTWFCSMLLANGDISLAEEDLGIFAYHELKLIQKSFLGAFQKSICP